MATRDEVLKNLRFRDALTVRDVGAILDYIDQEIVAAPFGLVALASGSESNAASVEFLDLDATFQKYTIVGCGLAPATDAVNLLCQVSTDNGMTWDTTGSDYLGAGYLAATSGIAATGSGITTGALVVANCGNDTDEQSAFVLDVIAPSHAAFRTGFLSRATVERASGLINDNTNGYQRMAAQVENAMRLIFNSGNITTLDWTLYGSRAAA